MAAQDKGLMLLNGRPMFMHVLGQLEQWHPPLNRLWISANRNQDRYAKAGHAVLSDARPGFPGPLAGIETALLASAAEWLMVVPCDMPTLPENLPQRLIIRAKDTGLARVTSRGRVYPVLCIVHRDWLASLSEVLDNSMHGVNRWQTTCGVRDLVIDQDLHNINDELMLNAASRWSSG